MADDQYNEVYRALRDAQNRYTYFVLAAAGGAIALAVNQTQSAVLAWSHLPLGIAVLLWGLSFASGCRQLQYVNSTLYSNSELLRIQSGSHPEITHPAMRAAASEGIEKAIKANVQRISQLGAWQFRMLIGGACVYLVWHVLQMRLRLSR